MKSWRLPVSIATLIGVAAGMACADVDIGFDPPDYTNGMVVPAPWNISEGTGIVTTAEFADGRPVYSISVTPFGELAKNHGKSSRYPSLHTLTIAQPFSNSFTAPCFVHL